MSTLETAQIVSELTVEQAAEILGFTEGHVNEILDDNGLKYRQQGDQRLIQRKSLLEFEREYKAGRAAMAELVRLSEEMGLYDGKPLKTVSDLRELSVEDAALILNMSKNRVNRLLDENLIESRTQDNVRLILWESLLKYDQKRKHRQALLGQLTREAQEMGLYDD